SIYKNEVVFHGHLREVLYRFVMLAAEKIHVTEERRRVITIHRCREIYDNSFRVKAPVTRRPPHRSGREGFPHPVPR
ncbi:MAG: hypothetical protein V3U60_06330, partial [Gammaproteobacteria bacterium]